MHVNQVADILWYKAAHNLFFNINLCLFSLIKFKEVEEDTQCLLCVEIYIRRDGFTLNSDPVVFSILSSQAAGQAGVQARILNLKNRTHSSSRVLQAQHNNLTGWTLSQL